MRVDSDGWLIEEAPGPKVVRVPANPGRVGGSLLAPHGDPLAPVWHTTDVDLPALKLAQRWQERPERVASAHVVLGRDGAVYQCIPFRRVAFHVKGGGVVAGRPVPHVNLVAVGIEMENLGGLKKISDAGGAAFYVWPFYKTDAAGNVRPDLGADPRLRVADDRAVRVQLVGGRYCDAFPIAQLEAAQALLGALVAAYAWRREHCSLGHVDFEPARKEDPWPLFRERHLPGILSAVFP